MWLQTFIEISDVPEMTKKSKLISFPPVKGHIYIAFTDKLGRSKICRSKIYLALIVINGAVNRYTSKEGLKIYASDTILPCPCIHRRQLKK